MLTAESGRLIVLESMSGMPTPNSVRFEPPDLCVLTFVGSISPEDIRAVFMERARLAAGLPHIYMLIDLSQVTSVSPAARKAIGDLSGGLPVRATVIVGAPFAIRALATLVSKGVQILKGARDTQLSFSATEAEGRAWLAGRGQGAATGP